MPYEVHEAWQEAWSCEHLVSIMQIWDVAADDHVPSTNLSDALNSISLSLQRLGDKFQKYRFSCHAKVVVSTGTDALCQPETIIL